MNTDRIRELLQQIHDAEQGLEGLRAELGRVVLDPRLIAPDNCWCSQTEEAAMLYFRRSRFFRSVVLPLTLIAILPACYKWSEIPGHNLPTRLPSPTRVTLTDGQQIVLTTATVTEDSLFGRREGTPGPVLDTDQNVRVSLDDVQIVEHRKTDGWATAGVIYLGVSVAVGLVCAASDCTLFELSN